MKAGERREGERRWRGDHGSRAGAFCDCCHGTGDLDGVVCGWCYGTGVHVPPTSLRERDDDPWLGLACVCVAWVLLIAVLLVTGVLGYVVEVFAAWLA